MGWGDWRWVVLFGFDAADAKVTGQYRHLIIYRCLDRILGIGEKARCKGLFWENRVEENVIFLLCLDGGAGIGSWYYICFVLYG